MRAKPALAALAALVLLSGCGLIDRALPSPGDDGPEPSPKTGEPLKTTVAEKPLGAYPEHSTVKLTLQRLGTEHLVAITEVTNTSDDAEIDVDHTYAPQFEEIGGFIGEPDQPYFGIGTLDPATRTLQLPYRYAEKDLCVCTKASEEEG